MTVAEFPFPVVVLAFSRPQALDALLSALLTQHRAVDPEQVTVLQDGVINPWSNDKKISFRQSDAVYEAARRHLPEHRIVRQDRNLGIALMYKEAFRLAFDVQDAEYAVFFEDDFLPGPFYTEALARLQALMDAHPRIAFANALGNIYPAESTGSDSIMAQHHLWGVLASRRQWRRVEARLADYYSLIEKVDDAERPHDRILDWFRSHDLGYVETSFDCVLAAMSAIEGLARINTRKAFGAVQRVSGVHMTDAVLDQFRVAPVGGLDDIAVLDISERELDAVVAAQFDFVAHDREITPERIRNLSAPAKVWRRQLAGPEAIRWAYRIILGREPNAAEVKAHEGGRHSLAEFRDLLLSSDEFRSMGGG